METQALHPQTTALLCASTRPTQPAQQAISADPRTRHDARAGRRRKCPSSNGTTVVGIHPQAIPTAGHDAAASTVHRRSCIPASAVLSSADPRNGEPERHRGKRRCLPEWAPAAAVRPTLVGRTAFMFQITQSGHTGYWSAPRSSPPPLKAVKASTGGKR